MVEFLAFDQREDMRYGKKLPQEAASISSRDQNELVEGRDEAAEFGAHGQVGRSLQRIALHVRFVLADISRRPSEVRFTPESRHLFPRE